jgi:hypothetical protein
MWQFNGVFHWLRKPNGERQAAERGQRRTALASTPEYALSAARFFVGGSGRKHRAKTKKHLRLEQHAHAPALAWIAALLAGTAYPAAARDWWIVQPRDGHCVRGSTLPFGTPEKGRAFLEDLGVFGHIRNILNPDGTVGAAIVYGHGPDGRPDSEVFTYFANQGACAAYLRERTDEP